MFSVFIFSAINAIFYGTQFVASSYSPTLLNLSSIPNGHEGNRSLTIVQSSQGTFGSSVLVETLNNGSHIYIVPHSGWNGVTVNWLHVGQFLSVPTVRQGQIEIKYGTRKLCKYITFDEVSIFLSRGNLFLEK